MLSKRIPGTLLYHILLYIIYYVILYYIICNDFWNKVKGPIEENFKHGGGQEK